MLKRKKILTPFILVSLLFSFSTQAQNDNSIPNSFQLGAHLMRSSHNFSINGHNNFTINPGIEIQKNYSNKYSLSLRIDYDHNNSKTKVTDFNLGKLVDQIRNENNIWTSIYFKYYLLKKHKMRTYFGMGAGVHIQTKKYEYIHDFPNASLSNSNQGSTALFIAGPTIGSDIPISNRSSISTQLIHESYISKLGLNGSRVIRWSLGYKFKFK